VVGPDRRLSAPSASPSGLSAAEAARRLAVHGPNRLPERRRTRFAGRLARQLVEPLSLLLLAAVAVSVLVLDELREGVAILVITVLNAVFGALQEHRADAAIAALRALTAPQAKVRRDGTTARVPVADVVPGDLVELEAGDRVPADVVVLEAHDLAVDEALLTGESLPVAKAATDDEASRHAFAGTAVVRGRALAEVVGTGAETEIGRLAASITPPVAVPLERELRRLGRQLALLAVGVGCLLVPVAAVRGVGDDALASAVLAGVALTVAAIPEGLPAAVTAALALGARHLAREGAIVRRLAAIEGLGSTAVLCVDKTGTLTTGRLAVQEVRVLGDEEALWAAALRANDAPLGGQDPVDQAIAAAGHGGEPGTRVAELAFDSELGLMATVHATERGPVLSVKGAPEAVLARCTPGPERDRAATAVEELSTEGFKVLAVADAPTDDLDAAGLHPLGLIALGDRPRPTAPEAVEACRRSGIRLVMVTGDHPATAVHVARQVGLDVAHVVTGSELADLDPEARRAALARADVVARVRPGTKVDLVEAHQQAGAIVGMTGDGVNDAPALNRADVGVALAGEGGTDVARQAADVVVTDDDLGTIVDAVRTGRRIYRNLGHVVAYLVAGNLSEILVVAAGMVVIPELAVPLLPVQLLWINLVTDGVPALALGVDRPTRDELDDPPRDPRDALLGWSLLRRLAGRAAIAAAGVLGATLVVRRWGWSPDEQRTQLLLTLLLVHLALVYVTRARSRSFGRGWYRGRAVGVAVACSTVVTVLAVAVPPLRRALELTALPVGGWLLAAVTVVVVIAAMDAARAWGTHRGGSGRGQDQRLRRLRSSTRAA